MPTLNYLVEMTIIVTNNDYFLMRFCKTKSLGAKKNYLQANTGMAGCPDFSLQWTSRKLKRSIITALLSLNNVKFMKLTLLKLQKQKRRATSRKRHIATRRIRANDYCISVNYFVVSLSSSWLLLYNALLAICRQPVSVVDVVGRMLL